MALGQRNCCDSFLSIRSHIEHVFAAQKHRLGLVICTIGIIRARAKIGLANHGSKA